MIFGKNAWIKTNAILNLSIIMIVAPLLNFLAGISFDLYAPSMPAIAQEFNTSIIAVKNTITITIVGFAIGCLLLGVLMDRYGRRTVIIPALFLYVAVSLLAVKVHTIQQLLMIRFFQGVFTAAAGICSRAIITDSLSGKRFFIGILYISIAYGFGLMVAPFFGGYLQYHFGWQANFYAYAACAAIILITFILFVNETLVIETTESIWQTTKFYFAIIQHPVFLAGTFILGMVLAEQLIYPTICVFIIQNTLGYSPIVYGNAALLMGLSYLLGTLANRLLLEIKPPKKIVWIGFTIMFAACMTQLLFAIYFTLTLQTLAMPLIMFNFGLGFIFGNVVGLCLKLFPKHAAMNTAVQSCLFMILGSLVLFLISSIKYINLHILALLFLALLLSQVLAFLIMQRKGI